MVEISFKWGEGQPTWVANASQYAREELGLYGQDELEWVRSTLGYSVVKTEEKISLIFERDSNYTATLLRWS